MSIKIGDVVYIWPQTKVTVESVGADGKIGIVWFDANNKLRRKTIDEAKVLGKA